MRFFRPFCLFVLGGILLAALTVCGALLLLPSETTSHLRYLLTHATALTPLNLLLPLYSASTFAIVTMQSVQGTDPQPFGSSCPGFYGAAHPHQL